MGEEEGEGERERGEGGVGKSRVYNGHQDTTGDENAMRKRNGKREFFILALS